MKDTRNITLIILTVTALILGAMLVGLNKSEPAYAVGAVKEGDFVMVNASISKNIDGIVVIDSITHTMKLYYPDTNRKSIVIKDSVDLEAAFKD